MIPASEINWAKVKRSQAHDADSLANIASGIGEYGIANIIWRLAEILRAEAREIELRKRSSDE